jgi:arsenate reductase-like glutaredoxin family protein
LGDFKKQNIATRFHDLRTDVLTSEKLSGWCRQLGWEAVLNKKSTTWRSLSQQIQEEVTNEQAAIQIMLQHPTLVKRPVIEMNERVTVGLNERILPNNKK